MIFFDVEGTALTVPGLEDPAAQPRIMEIGAVMFVKGQPRESWRTLDRLVNPECAIPDKAQEITGITPALLAHAPTFPEVLPEVIEFFRADPDNCLVAHNLSYDHACLLFELRRSGWEYRFPWPFHQVDTCAQYAANKSLQKWAHELGVLPPAGRQRHRALDDAWLMLECYLKAQTSQVAQMGLDL